MADLQQQVQYCWRDDPPSAAPIVSLEEFSQGSNASAVQLAPGEDARALLPHLDQLELVELAFPSFMDGRNYSSAQILREAGFAGEIRASGEILVDQIHILRRAGIDSVAPDMPLDQAAVERALSRYRHIYQRTSRNGDADYAGREAIWALRHPDSDQAKAGNRRGEAGA